jgi:hypothetical protein
VHDADGDWERTVSTRFASPVQHATTADGLVSVLVDDMIVYLHVIVNDMRILTALFPIWSIDWFTTRGPLLVARFPVFRLLFCKFPPLTHLINQGTPEDGKVCTIQFSGIADGAMDRPASKLDAVLFYDLSFVI